jgi:hypothetical protein
MVQNFMEPYSNNMALKAKKSISSNHSENECIDATQVHRRKYCSLRSGLQQVWNFVIPSPDNRCQIYNKKLIVITKAKLIMSSWYHSPIALQIPIGLTSSHTCCKPMLPVVFLADYFFSTKVKGSTSFPSNVADKARHNLLAGFSTNETSSSSAS